MPEVCECPETQAGHLAAPRLPFLSVVLGLMAWPPSLLHGAVLSNQLSKRMLLRGMDWGKDLLERRFAGPAVSTEPGAGVCVEGADLTRLYRDTIRCQRAPGSGRLEKLMHEF